MKDHHISASCRVLLCISLMLTMVLFANMTSYAQFRRRYHGIDLDFPGKKCSMKLVGAEVSDVLRTFANQYKLNLVVGADVSGKIDLTLKDVDIKDAFLTILRSAKLAYIKEGKIYRIMPLEKLAEENRLEESSLDMEIKIFSPQYASAPRLAKSMQNLLSKRDGTFIDADERTNSIVVKDIPQKLYEMERLFRLLDVEQVTDVRSIDTEIIELKFIDIKEMGKNVGSMISNAGRVDINEKTHSLIISDISENLVQIKNLINKLDKPSRQVYIKAKIVEVTKNFSRDIGIQWGGHYTDGPPSGKTFPKVTLTGMGDIQNFAVNLPTTLNPAYGGIGLSLGHINNKAQLDVQLKALEDKGEAHVSSSPEIVTLDNTKAVIETGTRVPYRTLDLGAGTAEAATVKYFDAFTRLEVIPHITSDNRIKMKIIADKDWADITKGVDGNPLIFRKGAETELIVKDGETTVIGGLSISESKESRKKVPWFADIPLIGALFKNSFKSKNYDEVLIFITPHIIEN
ncbi:hypothetical protein JXL19_04385 [bacterium]|nr:hypothetical protein [bacterium]